MPTRVEISRSLSEKVKAVTLLLLAFFSMGVIGILNPQTRQLFLKFIPCVVLFSFFLVLLFHEPVFNRKTSSAFILIAVVCWLIEAMGVSTGKIFGDYTYGSSLGPKLAGTPLLIGINWLLLAYCTAIIGQSLARGSIERIIISSALMVAYDFAMELVAPFLGMWHFNNGIAPLRNYIAWFALAMMIHSALSYSGIRFKNNIAPSVFIVQLFFFLSLALITRI
ncbi:MAG TPA: carotenoid biosynthesis protein [Bacteroidales bacterium]|nr:carotenoid biosynthesis protein [Bacteroidales bacterium]